MTVDPQDSPSGLKMCVLILILVKSPLVCKGGQVGGNMVLQTTESVIGSQGGGAVKERISF